MIIKRYLHSIVFFPLKYFAIIVFYSTILTEIILVSEKAGACLCTDRRALRVIKPVDGATCCCSVNFTYMYMYAVSGTF